MILNEGERAGIVASDVLSEWGLSGLAGRVGIVMEALNGPERTFKGYIVRLAGGDFEGEAEWFVPFCSVTRYGDVCK